MTTPISGSADARDPSDRTFARLAANALRYWESRRPLYNLALATVVFGHVFAAWPVSRAWLTRDTALVVFLLAVLANFAYCAAYAVDLFVQFSELRTAWPRYRWIVLLVGTAFAAVITYFIMLGGFPTGGPR
jgi:uncharacterized membrane protein